jgi:sugar/nucleoside kinase (ribokinase family)
MADVVVHGPVSWNLVVDLDELPSPEPHTQFAAAHREVIGGTSAGKSAHLRDRGIDVELHTVLGTGTSAQSIEMALGRAGIPLVATYVEGPSERHLNLMDRAGGRVSIYLDVPGDPSARSPRTPARLLEACTQARAVVLDLSQPSRDVIEAVAALGVPVWTDVHDYDGRSDFHAPFLHAASFVFMNGDRLDAPQDFLRSCVDRGARLAVCTLGADGAIAMDAERSVFHVPAVPVAEVVDSNGAGDGFMAGFLAAHLDDADIASAMAIGAEQAARALSTVQLSPLFEQHREAGV